MDRKQFRYMYEQSVEMRNKVNAWLIKHPPPGDTDPMDWAVHQFIVNRVVKASKEHHPDVYDRGRFHVPKSEIVKEAHRRRELGEDAGAQINRDFKRDKGVKYDT